MRAAERSARPHRRAAGPGVPAREAGSPRGAAAARPSRRCSCWPAARGSPPRTHSAPTRSACSIPHTAKRDLIVFDQRGTGRSGLLRCRRAGAGEPAARRGRGGRLRRARLGARRALYTSRDSADDIEAIREQLGAERIALFGTSYGTKVALGYALRYPARGRAAHARLRGARSTGRIPTTSTRSRRRRGRSARCAGATARGRATRSAELGALVRTHREQRSASRPPRGRARPAAERAASRACDLFTILVAGDFDPALRAAFPGAVHSALGGDAAPLLRLRRRAFEVDAEPPPPRQLSTAVYAATTCEEAPLPVVARRRRPTRPSGTARPPRALPRSRTRAFAPFDRATALASDTLEPLRALAAGAAGARLRPRPAARRAGADDRGRGRPPHAGRERPADGASCSRARGSSWRPPPATRRSAPTSAVAPQRAFARFVQAAARAGALPASAPRLPAHAPAAARGSPTCRPLPGTTGSGAERSAPWSSPFGDVADDSLTQLIFGRRAIGRRARRRPARRPLPDRLARTPSSCTASRSCPV